MAQPPNSQPYQSMWPLVAWPYVGVVAVLSWLVGWLHARSALCPADIASGTVGGGDWWVGGSLIFFIAFLVFSDLFMSAILIEPIVWPAPKSRTKKKPATGPVAASKPGPVWHLTNIVRALATLVIASLMAGMWLSYSFCARPQGIFTHATPFNEGKIYAWTDVSKITTYCPRTRHGRRTEVLIFDADMNDGQTLHLGDNQEQLIRNYRAVSDALRDVPFIYDNSRISECRSPPLRDLFATRPGTHANEPR